MKMKPIFNCLSLCLLLLLASNSIAQKDFDVKRAFAEMDTFMQQFVDYSDFREPLKDNVTSTSRDQFKSMFKPGVFILDLYNPERDAKAQFMPILPISPKIRTVEDFSEDVSSFCRNGMSVKFTGINADYSTIANGTVKLKVRMESLIRDFQEWKFTVYQEVLLQLEWVEQEKRYVISSYDVAENYVVKCSNCEDRFTAKVDPADDPKNPLKLWASLNGLGGMGNPTIANPQLSMLDPAVYSNLIESRSKIGELSAMGSLPYWGIEGMAHVMKGHKNQWGLSLGVGVFNTRALYTQEQSTLEYRATDLSGNEYNRSLTLDKTEISANLFSIYAPLHLNYSRRINRKLKVHTSLGAMVSLWGVMSTDQLAVADFDARLKFGNPDGSAVTTVFSQDGSADVVLSETTLTEQQQRTDLTSLSNYDLAFNKTLEGETKLQPTRGVSLLAKVGAGWMVNSSTEALVSIGAMGGKQQWETAPVSLVNRTSDVQTFGSALAGIGEWQSFSLLISGGVRFYLSSFKK